MQQGKLGDGVEIQLHELSDAGGNRMKWRSSTWVRGKEYSWTHTAAKKRTAMHKAAAKLLEELVPGQCRTTKNRARLMHLVYVGVGIPQPYHFACFWVSAAEYVPRVEV